MKVYIFGTLILIATIFQTSQVFAVDSFEEETTTVGDESEIIESLSEETEEGFEEETTTVGDDSETEEGFSEEGEEGFEEETTTVDTPDPKTEEPEPRRRSSGGSRKVPVANLSSTGEVLGASTEAGSCKVLTTFMRRGVVNNVEEVKMLQTFLNTNMNAGLPVTGFFGPLTEQAVKNFQLKYKTEILKPWVDLGLMTSQDIATGYVYKTTLFVINKMLCASAPQTLPVLN